MSKTKTLALGTVMAASLVASASALAEVSANASAVSQYYWRGVQLTDSAAVQGGIDYSHDSGFYAGTWASTLNGGNPSYEVDLYAGFGNEVGPIAYDVGYIAYLYPDAAEVTPGDGNDKWDFSEVYGSITWSFLTAGLAYTVSGEADDGAPFVSGDLYAYATVEFSLAQDWGVGATYGSYMFDGEGGTANNEYDYSHISLFASKDAGDYGSFGFNIELADIKETNGYAGSANSDDPKVWVSWGKDF